MNRRNKSNKLKWPTNAFLKKKFLRLVTHPIFLVLTVFGNTLIVAAAFALYFTERGINPNISSLLDTVWWAVATVTTVGYGDVIPVTPQGKVIGLILMIVGTALFWSYTALFADALISEELEDFEAELHRIEATLGSLKTSIATDPVRASDLIAKIESHIGKIKEGSASSN